MLEMKGCSLCNCFYLNTDKYTHGSNKGRGFDLLMIEKVYNSFIKKTSRVAEQKDHGIRCHQTWMIV